MRRLFLLLVLFALSTPVSTDAAENWTYGTSEHFEVYTTASAGTAREALTYFERIHTFFSDVLGVRPNLANKTRLIIFANDRQFAPYRPNKLVEAFYLGGADRDYIVMKRLDADSIPIVVHEYTHLVVRHSGVRFPIWLNEGLAEYNSTLRPHGGKMRFGDPPAHHLLYLRSGVAMFELSRLFEIGHDSPEYNSRNHAGVLYSQSWALVHMLSMDNRYRPGWPRFRDLVGAGTDSAAALTQVYGRTPEQVGRDLANYVTRDQYSAYETKDKYEVAQAKKYETRPADAFEGALVTANLVANAPDGEERARAAYATLEQQKPDALPLLEARAYFEWRRESREAALPYFERAIEHGTRNLELLRDYMRLEPSKAEAILPKAMALAPNDPDVRIEHAAVLLRERQSSQAVLTLRDVLKTLDSDQSFRAYQILANAYMQLNQIDDARTAAAQVARVAENASEAEFANRLLSSIDTFAEQQAAFDARSRAATAASDAGTRNAGQPGEGVLAPLVTPERLSGAAEIVMVSGRLRNIVSCTDGEHAILEVLSNGQTLRLYIDDGLKISVRGHSGSTIDLSCRAYDMPIVVGYQPGVDAQRNTIGYVRLLDYSN